MDEDQAERLIAAMEKRNELLEEQNKILADHDNTFQRIYNAINNIDYTLK